MLRMHKAPGIQCQTLPTYMVGAIQRDVAISVQTFFGQGDSIGPPPPPAMWLVPNSVVKHKLCMPEGPKFIPRHLYLKVLRWKQL